MPAGPCQPAVPSERPDQLWVSDVTYVSTWQGWQYVALVIEVFARRIVGWRQSSSIRTDFVLDALKQALYARQPERNALICHSDRGLNTSASPTPSGWQSLASSRRLEAMATPITTPWPRLPTGRTGPSSSTASPMKDRAARRGLTSRVGDRGTAAVAGLAPRRSADARMRGAGVSSHTKRHPLLTLMRIAAGSGW